MSYLNILIIGIFAWLIFYTIRLKFRLTKEEKAGLVSITKAEIFEQGCGFDNHGWCLLTSREIHCDFAYGGIVKYNVEKIEALCPLLNKETIKIHLLEE